MNPFDFSVVRFSYESANPKFHFFLFARESNKKKTTKLRERIDSLHLITVKEK